MSKMKSGLYKQVFITKLEKGWMFFMIKMSKMSKISKSK